jgi:hypothetical protein
MKLFRSDILKIFIKIICMACIAVGLTTVSSAIIGPVENTYEEILQENISGSTTQVPATPEGNKSTGPEELSDTEDIHEITEALKDNYMDKVMQNIEERKKIDKNKDILFIGNSLTEGMRLTTNSRNKFICEVGVSLDGLNLSEIKNMDFKVVVINMGTNELGHYSEEHFKTSYNNLIDIIQNTNPEARIILCSVPPIAEITSYASSYNNENAKIYSQYIRQIANERELSYIDNSEFFGDVLRPEWTEDGLHFSGNVYIAWYNFLVEKI